MIGSASANALAAEADVVLAIGTRLQDFTTGSWTVFGNPEVRLIALNAARFDATKHRRSRSSATPRSGSASSRPGSPAGRRRRPGWSAPPRNTPPGTGRSISTPGRPTRKLPAYAQVVGAINRVCDPTDLALTAAGGLPGELCKNWKAKSVGTFDCEFGFSCMGYEIAGGWGAKMADPERDVIVFTGDGSYLMLNSDIYSSVLTGHKLIVVVCDNGGFAVINRLQNFKGSASFNNLIEDCRRERDARVDFAAHARSDGCALPSTCRSIGDLEAAFQRAKAADRTYVIVIDVHPHQWTPGDAWWDVAVPEVSRRKQVRDARAAHEAGLAEAADRGLTMAATSGAGPIRLGIAPIGWSNDDLPELGGDITLEQCLREAREAGYAGVEKGGKFPLDPKVLRADPGRAWSRPGHRLVLGRAPPRHGRAREAADGPAAGALSGAGRPGDDVRRDHRHGAEPDRGAGRRPAAACPRRSSSAMATSSPSSPNGSGRRAAR